MSTQITFNRVAAEAAGAITHRYYEDDFVVMAIEFPEAEVFAADYGDEEDSTIDFKPGGKIRTAVEPWLLLHNIEYVEG